MRTNHTPRELLALQPDPLEPRAEGVERYVEALQVLAGTDPDLARRQSWNQIRLAGTRAGRRRAEAHESLNRIFRLGTVPKPALDGRFEGVAVTPRPSLVPTRPCGRSLLSGCLGSASASTPRRRPATT
jgi:hypothetical protein